MNEIERDEFAADPIEVRRAGRRVFWMGVGAASLAAAIASVIAVGGTGEARAMRGLFGRDHGPHRHGFADREGWPIRPRARWSRGSPKSPSRSPPRSGRSCSTLPRASADKNLE